MKRRFLLLATLSLFAAWLLFLSPAAAQTGGGYDLTWNTVDCGGGTNSSGRYILVGTIGQPDAAAWKGGNYTLAGGLWGGSAGAGRVYLPLVLRGYPLVGSSQVRD